MAFSYWTPANISQICAEQGASLTQCSQLSVLFFHLVTQFYGSSVDLRRNPYGSDYNNDYQFSNFESGISRKDSKAANEEVYSEFKCKREKMKNEKKKGDIEEYDFIVVGGGSGGCVVASRLSEYKHWKVLLLEAGTEEPDVTSVPGFPTSTFGSSIDWNYRTQPEELTCRSMFDQSCAWYRGKTMGGCSAINLMVYMRGNKRDYDNWAEKGNHGWSYKEVLPYFIKNENNQNIESVDKNLHGFNGPLNVESLHYIDINSEIIVQAFQEKGLPRIDLNGEQQIGANLVQTTTKDGRRMSANVAYIRPIRYKRRNLVIKTEAFVTKILIDPETKIAYGVNYVKDGKMYTVHAKKEVIVSGGAINSPKLLMLSGVGPKEHLESLNIPVISNLSVGKNLQDHATTTAIILKMTNTSTLINGQQLLKEVLSYHKQEPKKNGPLSATGGVGMTAFLNSQSSTEDAPDLQYHFYAANIKDVYSDPTAFFASDVLPLSFYDGLFSLPVLLTPKSRGYILLNQTDPIYSAPLIYPRFFTEKEDLDVLLAGTKIMLGLEETEAFKSNGLRFLKEPIAGCSDYEWGSDDYFTCLYTHYTFTIFHPVGTCKMGPSSDKDAVVDPLLQVYGVQKLRVVDASIMPYIIRGNTNVPTQMIAEKASDMIKKKWLVEPCA